MILFFLLNTYHLKYPYKGLHFLPDYMSCIFVARDTMVLDMAIFRGCVHHVQWRDATHIIMSFKALPHRLQIQGLGARIARYKDPRINTCSGSATVMIRGKRLVVCSTPAS